MTAPLHKRLKRALDDGRCTVADVASRCASSVRAVEYWRAEERSPKGAFVRRELERFLDEIEKKNGRSK